MKNVSKKKRKMEKSHPVRAVQEKKENLPFQ
jgi:hypothetical protein